VSSTRTVAPPRASASTRKVADMAPIAAEHCTPQSEAPTSSANKAPTDEPPDTPSTYESASGLRNKACNSTPAKANSEPIVNADSSRGARSSITTVRAGSAASPNRAAMAGRTPMSVDPATRPRHATTTASDTSMANRRLEDGREGTMHCLTKQRKPVRRFPFACSAACHPVKRPS
jgi:hypothetical protein